MKRAEFIFNTISLPVDFLALSAAGVAAYFVRYRAEQIDIVGPVIFDLSLAGFLSILIRAIPAVLIIFALLGLYNIKGTQPFRQQISKVVIGVSLASLFTIVLFFFNQSIFPSRFIILAAWILSIVFVIGGRLILKIVQRVLFSRNFGLHRLIIINGQNKQHQAIDTLFQSKKYGYQVVAEFKYSPNLVDELDNFIDDNKVDELVQTNSDISPEQNMELAILARTKGLSFSFIPNLFEVQRNVIELHSFRGIPMISLKNTPLDGWGRVVKRLLDIIVSVICIIITLPVYLAIILAIKLNSPGPILYTADRVGRKKHFQFYKFRSMYTHLSVGEKYGSLEAYQALQELIKKEDETNRSGPLHKIKNDPRVTPVGRFLRRTKLDELPQFWNVLKGDMSMVGHRPHLPDQVEKYRRGNERIFNIKPGIFGLTQLAQIAWPALPFEEEIKLDTYYIENWSLRLDLVILFRSFIALFFGKSQDDY